ncbi:MAG: apolipoprotein N-acyltransferase [Mariprofundaceae bacterium]
MQFSFAPTQYFWLAIVALSLVIFLLQQKNTWLTAYCFGFGWFGIGSWWLAPTFHSFGGLNWLLSAAIIMIIGLIMGLFPALWLWGCQKLTHTFKHSLMIVLPMTAILMEWLRGHLFTGLPWVSLGTLSLDTPAAAWISIFGTYGMAFLPCLIAVSLAFLYTRQLRRTGLIGLIFCSFFIWLAPAIPEAEGPQQQVVLIQPNIPQDHKWDSQFLNSNMQNLISLSAQHAKHADLIIWPEAAIPFYLEQSPSWDQYLTQQMQIWNTTVLFGALKLFPASQSAQNGLYLFDPEQQASQRSFAGKKHLVPFGEYVPSWLPWLHKIVPDIGNFQPATDDGVLSTNSEYFGSLICYESIFPEQARQRVQDGAKVLTIVTNDAWYGHSPAAWQHLQAAQARAIETGRYVLRAANTGVSAIIAPNGHITASAPWWTQTALTGTYHSSNIITPYQYWGDFPALLISLFSTLFILFLGWLKRRQQK